MSTGPAEWTDYVESECACATCSKMCEAVPCVPLPSEVEDMPADRLALSDWDGHVGPVEFLMAAPVERERTYVAWRYGRCTFLTDGGRCELHGRCKPIEGRVAACGDRMPAGHDETVLGLHLPNRLHELLYQAWDSAEGREVVARWKARVGYPEDPEA